MKKQNVRITIPFLLMFVMILSLLPTIVEATDELCVDSDMDSFSLYYDYDEYKDFQPFYFPYYVGNEHILINSLLPTEWVVLEGEFADLFIFDVSIADTPEEIVLLRYEILRDDFTILKNEFPNPRDFYGYSIIYYIDSVRVEDADEYSVIIFYEADGIQLTLNAATFSLVVTEIMPFGEIFEEITPFSVSSATPVSGSSLWRYNSRNNELLRLPGGQTTPHFRVNEVRCGRAAGCRSCGDVFTFCSNVVQVMHNLRVRYGRVDVISGFRCLTRNSNLPNASPRSRHMTGEAADIRIVAHGSDVRRMFNAALAAGAATRANGGDTYMMRTAIHISVRRGVRVNPIEPQPTPPPRLARPTITLGGGLGQGSGGTEQAGVMRTGYGVRIRISDVRQQTYRIIVRRLDNPPNPNINPEPGTDLYNRYLAFRNANQAMVNHTLVSVFENQGDTTIPELHPDRLTPGHYKVWVHVSRPGYISNETAVYFQVLPRTGYARPSVTENTVTSRRTGTIVVRNTLNTARTGNLSVSQVSAPVITTNPPQQPMVSGIPTVNSLAVSEIVAPNGWSTLYRIRVAPSSDWGEWQLESTFIGLEPNTDYQVQAQFIADNPDTHVHSDESPVSANIRTAVSIPVITLALNVITDVPITNGGRQEMRFTAPSGGTFRFETLDNGNLDPVAFSSQVANVYVENGGEGTGEAFLFERQMTAGETLTFWAGVWQDSTDASGSYSVRVVIAGLQTTAPPTQRIVSGTPTTNSIAVNASTAPSGWTTQYRIRHGVSGVWSEWQNSNTFTGLLAGTDYQVQARFTANNVSTHEHSVESPVSDNIRTATADVLLGDLNRDGIVCVIDLGLLRAHLVHLPVDICLVAADVNQDGEVCVVDLGLLRAYLVHLIPSLPPSA